jgi:serine protease Do
LLSDQGVEVREVAPRGIADRAGIRADDVIIALAGRLVTSIDDLHRLLMALPADQGFELTVIRGERQQIVYVSAK